uniref:Uncharacterized protein n=1 Tax=Cebus imitator TaxID=2715852 RepID=A0A2K5RJB0_CEBIM
MARNTIPQLVKGLPSSGSNLSLHHNWVSSPIWNLLQACKYSLNWEKFLPNSIWLPNITGTG